MSEREKTAETVQLFSSASYRHRRLPYLAVPLKAFGSRLTMPDPVHEILDWPHEGSRMSLHGFANRERENAFR